MIRSAHIDTFARDHLPPAEQQPDFLLDFPDVRYPERINCVDRVRRRLGRQGPWRPRLPDLAGRAPDLCRPRRTGEPHRQRAHPRSRPGAGEPRAAARPQLADDGGGLFRRHQGRRRRGRDHAALARQGDRVPADQGRDQARAVRRAARRRNGEGAGRSRRRSSASSIGAPAPPTASKR